MGSNQTDKKKPSIDEIKQLRAKRENVIKSHKIVKK